MNLGEFEWRCASSVLPSAIGAFLFNFPFLLGQYDQGSSRKMGVSPHDLEIFLLTFLDWPSFHLADSFFMFWMPFKKLWDMYSSYLFSLMTMQKDSDCQFQAQQNAGRIDMVILLSIRMLFWIRRCCEKDYESCVIVFYATISFRMCMFQIFARKSVRFRMWTKSLTQIRSFLKLCCLIRFVFWILSGRLLRNKVIQKHATPPLVLKQLQE